MQLYHDSELMTHQIHYYIPVKFSYLGQFPKYNISTFNRRQIISSSLPLLFPRLFVVGRCSIGFTEQLESDLRILWVN